MAGDCGDEIPSKSKLQSAGVKSCVNFPNLLKTRHLYSFFFNFSDSEPDFFFNFSPNRYVLFIFSKSLKDSLHSLYITVLLFYFSVVLLLVYASPEDLCGSFFFFLNGSSFPSASILSHTCSSAYQLRYCLPEMSFLIELLAVW